MVRLYLTSQRIILRSEVMIRCTFTSFLLILVVCTFCGKEFKSLSHHVWRYKDKIKGNRDTDQDDATDGKDAAVSPQSLSSPNQTCSTITCSCGKICSGRKGLKMHHRSCRVIKGLAGETFEIH